MNKRLPVLLAVAALALLGLTACAHRVVVIQTVPPPVVVAPVVDADSVDYWCDPISYGGCFYWDSGYNQFFWWDNGVRYWMGSIWRPESGWFHHDSGWRTRDKGWQGGDWVNGHGNAQPDHRPPGDISGYSPDDAARARETGKVLSGGSRVGEPGHFEPAAGEAGRVGAPVGVGEAGRVGDGRAGEVGEAGRAGEAGRVGEPSRGVERDRRYEPAPSYEPAPYRSQPSEPAPSRGQGGGEGGGGRRR